VKLAGKAFLITIAPLACLVPVFGDDYQITFVMHTALFVGLAYSWNLLSGYTGYLSFGQMAYVGIGMYAFALGVIDLHWPFLVAAAIAGVVAGVAAVPIGWVILRFRGLEFAVGTLAVSQLLQVASRLRNPVTGASTGLFLPPVLDTIELYFLAIGLVALLILATWGIENSRFGLKLLSIREDEVAARSLGINTTRTKISAYALSAIAPGIIGGLWAWDFGYVDPSVAFNVLWEVTFITMVIFGGMGKLWGPLFGAALGFVSEYLWATFPFTHLAINGAVIVLVVLFMPSGLVSLLEKAGILGPTRTMTTRVARRVNSMVQSPLVPPPPRQRSQN